MTMFLMSHGSSAGSCEKMGLVASVLPLHELQRAIGQPAAPDCKTSLYLAAESAQEPRCPARINSIEIKNEAELMSFFYSTPQEEIY